MSSVQHNQNRITYTQNSNCSNMTTLPTAEPNAATNCRTTTQSQNTRTDDFSYRTKTTGYPKDSNITDCSNRIRTHPSNNITEVNNRIKSSSNRRTYSSDKITPSTDRTTSFSNKRTSSNDESTSFDDKIKSSSTSSIVASRDSCREPTPAMVTRSQRSTGPFSLPHRLLLTVVMVAALAGRNGGTEPGLRQTCPLRDLRWVPHYLKPDQRMFSSMMNSGSCPTWMTRNLMTKQPQHLYLTLPLGVPFAYFCGMCHRPSKIATNITMMHTTAEMQPIAQVSLEASRGQLQHKKKGLQCRVDYALTAALTDSGTMSCDARYGVLNTLESASYIVYDVPIIDNEETIEVASMNTVLTCPRHEEPETSSNPLVHVWFYPHVPTPTVAAPTTNPSVTFKLRNAPLVVACATYHIFSVSTVMLTTFTVRRVSAYQLKGENMAAAASSGGTGSRSSQVSPVSPQNGVQVWDGHRYETIGEEDYEGKTAGYQFPAIMVAMLSAGAAVVFVVVVMFAVKCMRRGGSNRNNYDHS